MKHLKKILIVMVVLALLVGSAFAVIAADEAEGVAKLNEYLTTVKNEASVTTKSVTLRDMFAYHDSYDWSDNPAGYDAAMDEAYSLVVSIGEEIENQLKTEESADSPDEKKVASYYDLLNAHFLGCDAPAGTAGLDAIVGKLQARNEATLEALYATYDATDKAEKRVLDDVRVAMQTLITEMNELYPISNADLIAKYKNAAFVLAKELLAEYGKLPRPDVEITKDMLEAKAPETDEPATAEVLSFEISEEAKTLIKKNAPLANMDTVEYATKYFYFERANKIILLENLVNSADFDESDEVNELIQCVATYVEARNAEIAQKAADLDALANLDDYKLPTHISKDYNGNLTTDQINKLSKDKQTAYKNNNDLFNGVNAQSEHRTARYTEGMILDDVDGDGQKEEVPNGYQALIYGNGTTIPHLYIEPALNGKAEEYGGMVLDTDIRLYENFSNANSYSMYSVDNSFGSGNSKFHTFLVWKRDETTGEVYVSNESTQSKLVQGFVKQYFYDCFALDVWSHYTITYDADKRIGELYINYEKVLDLYYSPDYAMRGLRWGPTSVANFRWDLDNVEFYAGTQYRDLDKFDEMTAGERFVFYVEYAANEKYPYLSRNIAYKEAQKLLPDYKNDFGYASTVSLFNSIDYEADIKKNAMIDNLAELKTLVKELVGAENLPLDADLLVDDEIACTECGFCDELGKFATNDGAVTCPECSAEVDAGDARTSEEKIEAEYKEYPGIELKSDNVSEINALIVEINEFVSDNGELINKGDTSEGGYQELMSAVYSTEANIKHVENAVAFATAVEKFYRATTLAALTRHSLSAQQVYELAGFSEAEIRAFIENDTVILNFENKYNNTVTLADGTTAVLNEGETLSPAGEVVLLKDIDPANIEISKEDGESDDDFNARFMAKLLELGYRMVIAPDPSDPANDDYVTIFEYYSEFAGIMATREKYENSRRIVNCVNYIIELDGYENTVEFFAANYETIASYMNIIRDMVRENAYDAEYAGVDEALDIFWELDIYFYKLLQQEHITYIEGMLAKYPLTNAYIEKLSIVLSMQDYFASEDLAITNNNMSYDVETVVADEMDRLNELKLVLEVYASEIDGLNESYEDVLEQQTQYFVNTVNHMKTLKDIAEIKELYATATSYYYGINVNTEGAPEAIAVYNEYRAMLAEADENAKLLEIVAEKINDAVNLSGMEKRSEIYSALKEGAAYVQILDDTSISAKISLQTYQLALADYITENAAFNDAIFESEQFTNATRSGKLSPTILAVISSIIAAN